MTAQGTESTSPESKISPAAYLRPQGCISCPNRSHETTSPGHQWSTSCTILFCSQKLESRSKKLKFNSSRALQRKCLVCVVIFPLFCVALQQCLSSTFLSFPLFSSCDSFISEKVASGSAPDADSLYSRSSLSLQNTPL